MMDETANPAEVRDRMWEKMAKRPGLLEKTRLHCGQWLVSCLRLWISCTSFSV